jgi:hypothetical protein
MHKSCAEKLLYRFTRRPIAGARQLGALVLIDRFSTPPSGQVLFFSKRVCQKLA